MDFDYTEEQQLLKDSIEKFLAKNYSFEQRRAIVDSREGMSAAAWEGFASMGLLGLPIPEVVGADFDGTEVRISRDGRAKILIFLAHWCPHCQAEVPVVQDWYQAGNLPDDVDLIAVATSTNSARVNYPPSAWLEEEGFQPPVIVDSLSARP